MDATPRGEAQWVDFVLGETTAEERAELRSAVVADPHTALEMADAVQLIERFRSVRTEPSPLLACKMTEVQRVAERWLVYRPRSGVGLRIGVLLGCAAATLLVLLIVDPATRLAEGDAIRLRARAEHVSAWLPAVLPEPAPEAPVQNTPANLLEPMTSDDPLLAAGCRVLSAVPPPALASWLGPSNLLAVQRIDYELRASAERRRAALRERGVLAAFDDRVQAIADRITDDLAFRLLDADTSPIEVAYIVRALLASGTAGPDGRHRADLDAAAGWLARRLPDLRDGDLAVALLALAERAASTLDGGELLREHTERLLAQSLEPSGGRWLRPDLLAGKSSVAQLADCGRLLLMAPGFGVDAECAYALRSLVTAHLEERRQVRSDDPAVLAALAYGCADLVTDPDELEQRLRAWRPAAVAPDYLTLMHLAWSRIPGTPGFARFQLDLRRIGTRPTPADPLDQAAMLLCLATSFAAPGVSALAQLND